MKHRYEAVLFDLDGVVIDSNAGITQIWQKLAGRYGLFLTPEDFTEHIYGRLASHTLFTFFGHLPTAQRQAVVNELNYFELNRAYETIAGVVPFLETLQHHQIPAALVTGSALVKTEAALQKLGITHLFSAIVTANDIQHGKPHPAAYQLGAQRLGVAPQNCIVFEDAISGIQSGVAAGAFCIGIQEEAFAAGLIQNGAKAVVRDFTSLRIEESPTGDKLLYFQSAAKPLVFSANAEKNHIFSINKLEPGLKNCS